MLMKCLRLKFFLLLLILSLFVFCLNILKYSDIERISKSYGENGSAVYLNDPEDIEVNEILYQKTGMYVLVSEKISVNRSIPDTRPTICHTLKYSKNLPSVSIIIIFHNEVLSMIKRTLHSIWNRTPNVMIHEIILVNDASTEQETYKPLRNYVASYFGDKIKIKELKQRSGLIVARLEGARIATGEVLIFLDSHIEVNENWLPPLISPIKENKKIATVPVIDDFSSKTFEYFKMPPTRGAFDWTFTFKELPIDDEDTIEPFQVPVMLGCAFAIDRSFFLNDLRGYDEQLEVWNGENYELSFKLHLCADGLLKVPCSRIGHTFREINPTRVTNHDYVARNFKRIAEVWLDEFKDVLYSRDPKRYETVDAGDLSKQKSLRKQLKCKPFVYFLANIAKDLVERYPPFYQVPVFASGVLKSLSSGDNFCLVADQQHEASLRLSKCDNNLIEPKKFQHFSLTFFKQIEQSGSDLCIDSFNMRLLDCHYEGGNQYWKFDYKSKMLINKGKFCLSANVEMKTVTKEICNEFDRNQKWMFGYFNHTAMNDWQNINGFRNFINFNSSQF
ncbi:CLUMA_CG016401, isoform A [Clunio marinus]|uniref:Polypeptide N-acetylgalactosaminyltransferase n=1 Tax=Clunio marinus TaxID=568069 RepID=A0A1J1IWP4_9DIPT|nr:CLUMA_CG016401, isoform A [Clunio marinus]